jgi:hypothetical protein
MLKITSLAPERNFNVILHSFDMESESMDIMHIWLIYGLCCPL